VRTCVSAPLPPKLARFHQALREAGRLLDLAAGAPAAAPPPLRETEAIARAVRERIAAHQQRLDRGG
jgi:hypothetical protein